MASRFVVHRNQIADRPVAGATELPVLTEEFGSAFLTQTVRALDAGSTAGPYASGDNEEVLFVLTGTGALLLGGQEIDFAPESGILIVPGETYRLRADSATEIVAVRVLRPAGDDVAAGPRRVISRLDELDVGQATAGREYRILAGPETGFRSGTHFVGYIPTGAAAPVHYHRYDEVIYVIEGEAVLHIEGEHNPLRAGTCVLLPARVLHQIENIGDIPVREVAVFVPGGSPAAAYLPDGTSAYPDVPDDPDR
ncbi:MAG TPA: cupin domain-containing protein [Pseudonocardiaceae bacterium]|nr:cupin domain-containing protein [Pseudonocardiaceae bacterium]